MPDSPDAPQADFATRLLAAPLSLGLGLVALVQLASWLPHYLTWPYWADHDVFASAALAWDQRVRPYRDVRQNNFPGTTYIFYILGKLGGWGRPWTFYAFDATLLVGLVVMLPAWSRRMFGRALPGLVGSLAFLSDYLSLNYCHAAQRDWQGPCFSVLALLAAQGWPGRTSRVASAGLAACAFAIRPQTVLFLPAILWAVAATRDEGPAWRRGGAWLGMLALFAGLAFLPLVVNGIMGDFLGSLRRVAFGSSYNRVGPASVARGWLLQASAFRWLVVPAGLGLLGFGRRKWLAGPWLVAMAGVSLYKPLSPVAHSYLDLPLMLAWSASLAVLAGLWLEVPGSSGRARLAGVLLLLGLGTTTLRPEFCVIGPNRQAPAALRGGVEPEAAPPGYRHGSVATSAFYPWADYRAMLLYLRDRTGPETTIANALKGDPAVAAEVGRRSAFPAESVAWLRMVDPGDEPAFAEALERAGDSVAVWVPGETGPDPKFRTPRIDAVIRRRYAFEARFGVIEVWRRRDEAGR